MFWVPRPSFNSATAAPEHKDMAVINTFLALCSGTVTVFAWSRVLSGGFRAAEEGDTDLKFDPVHIQNSVLAGAVAIGAVADLYVRPGWAVFIGIIAGSVSTFGYVFMTPWLMRNVRLHDTCGIHNLHGMPGILGSVASAIVCHAARDAYYGGPGSVLARFPKHTALLQGRAQWAGLGCTLGLALASGALTGLILRLLPQHKGIYFNDDLDWVVNQTISAVEETEKLEAIRSGRPERVEMVVIGAVPSTRSKRQLALEEKRAASKKRTDKVEVKVEETKVVELKETTPPAPALQPLPALSNWDE